MNRILAFSCAVSVFTKIAAQPVYPDAGMWNTFSVEKLVNQKFSLALDHETRLNENFSQLNLFYTNIGASYKPFDFLKIAFAYRHTDKWRKEQKNFSYRHRLMIDITFKKKINPFVLSYRHRLQTEEQDVLTSDDGMLPEWFSRNKFELKLDFDKRYVPYVGIEARYQFRDPRNSDFDNGWHRNRYYTGVDYEINKNNSCGIYYLIQREYDISSPQNLYILGLQYSLTLSGKEER